MRMRPRTRDLALLSLLAFAVAAGVSCAAARGRDARPRLADTVPTAIVVAVPGPHVSEPVPPSSEPSTAQSDDGDAAAAAGPRRDCERRASFSTTLGDDTKPTRVEWFRCGPHEAIWSDAGELLYPRDRLTLTRAGEKPLLLYSNDAEPGLDELDYVEAVHVGTGPGAQLFYSVHSYGTGNIHDWKVLDRLQGSLRTWLVDSPPRGAPLRADEHLGKQVGMGVVRRGSIFVETVAVYGNHDPNCCPTRGALSVEYLAQSGRLAMRRVWRHALPP